MADADTTVTGGKQVLLADHPSNSSSSSDSSDDDGRVLNNAIFSAIPKKNDKPVQVCLLVSTLMAG